MATTNLSLNQPSYNSSSWDVPINANATILDAQLASTTSVALTSSNVTLSSPNTSGTGQTQSMRILLTGTLTANVIVYFPSGISGKWIVYNTTSGAFTVTIASLGGGTSVSAPQGYNISIYSDGTNIRLTDDGLVPTTFPYITVTGNAYLATSSGNVGIGNSSPSYKLDVTGTGRFTGALTLGSTLSVASSVTFSTALTVPNGGTGLTTLTTNGIVYGAGTSALNVTAAGTTGQVLIGNTGSAPSWSAATGVAVTSISFGSTGLTPNTATQGAVTVAGTLVTGNGGTGLTTFTAANNAIYSTSSSALTAGTLPVAAGGTGATTLAGYLYGNGTSAVTASTTIPNTAITGLGTMSTQAASSVAITGGSINGTAIGGSTAAAGTFTTVTANTSISGRYNSRVSSAASPSSISVDISSYDEYVVTALANAISFPASTTGTPLNGNKMIIRLKDNGTARAISWTTSGAGSWRAVNVSLPTTTVVSSVLYIGAIYNSDESYWDVVAVAQQ